MRTIGLRAAVIVLSVMVTSCSLPAPAANNDLRWTPSEVIDLGASVTEDLPERTWGKALLKQMGFTTQNQFDVRRWTFPVEGGSVSGSNAYYNLFNHGGPHIDAPNHMGEGGGIDSYPIEGFFGPLKAFDVRTYANGRSVPVSVFQGAVEAGDVVVIVTGHTPPQTETALPEVTALNKEAAEFLATLPVRAIGTDAFSIDALTDLTRPSAHHSFLSRGIPVYEQLFNVEKVLGKARMFFVGVPLNIEGGDGMMVRPVVFVY